MRTVPQDKYDDDYFTHNCEGYTADGMPGRRLETLLSHIDIKFGNVLDTGCGRGEIAKCLVGKGFQVISIDYSLAAMRRFHEVNGANCTFIRHDVARGMDWLRENYFDCVILADIVEHLYPEDLLVLGKDTVRVARRGALILIDTPIMKGGESELHVDIKESVQEVHKYFQGTELVNTHWYKKPEHCNIILRKS
jgi:2-polyprenyl-3-methyl-5-hydroxy-6-metoxy-1,4-benzoquinol methylase